MYQAVKHRITVVIKQPGSSGPLDAVAGSEFLQASVIRLGQMRLCLHSISEQLLFVLVCWME